MPIYVYKHSCGHTGEFLLRNESRERVPTKCQRCGRGAIAFIDRSQKVGEKDGNFGTLERGQKP